MDYIRRLQKGELPEKYDSENWFVPINGRVSSVMPTHATPEPKRRFVPSLWEAKRVRPKFWKLFELQVIIIN